MRSVRSRGSSGIAAAPGGVRSVVARLLIDCGKSKELANRLRELHGRVARLQRNRRRMEQLADDAMRHLRHDRLPLRIELRKPAERELDLRLDDRVRLLAEVGD